MSRKTEIQVGLTVLLAIATLIWGVTWLKEFQLQSRVRIWHVSFPATGGLGRSDEVQVNGIRKGAVQSTTLLGDRVMVNLGLSSELTLTSDCRVAIRNIGLMGEKVIAVDLRTTGTPYTQRDTIPGVYELGIPEVMSQLGATVSSVSDLSEQLGDVTRTLNKHGDLTAAVHNLRRTSEDLQATVSENRAVLRQTLENFAAVSKSAKSLTSDRESELRKTLENFSSAAEKMNRLTDHLDSLRAVMQSIGVKVDRGEGTLGEMVNDKRLYANLSASVDSLRALIADIKKNPKRYLTVHVF